MAQVVIENLDPIVVEKLKALAQQHGRSLEAELKAILTQAAQIEVSDRTAKEVAEERINRARDKYADQTFSDSAELLQENRQQDLSTVIQKFKALRQRLSLEGLSVREMIEEGRRF
jgi:plasmid stability protein